MSDTANCFINTYKYPEWFTHKTYSFYMKKLEQLKRFRYIHTEAASYYDKQHLKLYAPSIIITGLSGIASFLSSSSLVNDRMQTGLSIGVGVLASVSAMIQSAASAVDYSTKAKLHREAGEEYEKLMTMVEFEMEMPNEPNFIDNLEKLILETQNKCKYAVPKHIIDKYLKHTISVKEKAIKMTNKRVKRKLDKRKNDNDYTQLINDKDQVIINIDDNESLASDDLFNINVNNVDNTYNMTVETYNTDNDVDNEPNTKIIDFASIDTSIDT